MQALVCYESLFGNTRAVAEAVADGLRAARPDAVVECRGVDEAAASLASHDLDLVVLGAPTHFWRLTGSVSRAMESRYERRMVRVGAGKAPTRRADPTTGMRSRLAALPPGRGRVAAAFDTSMTGPLTGGARGAIARRLQRAGYRLLAEPETFLVEAVAGPLRPGELERARAWGAVLARALDENTIPNRRTTMQRSDAHIHSAPDAGAADRPFLPAPRPPDTTARPHLDVTRVLTTAQVVLGAVLVARYLSRRPGSSKALVTMGPGGWVSMKGGTVAVRRGSRPWGRPRPVQPTSAPARAPLWARVLSAVPLQALTR